MQAIPGLALLALLTVTAASAGNTLPPPLSVDKLREADFDVTLVRERELDHGPGYTAYLVSYEHAGLKLHAMIARPTTPPPPAGFPILVANHGYVPDPRKYGANSRPGDYYRPLPEMFTSRGFLTVIPDYRGHNDSEGFEFIDPQDERSVDYYAEDVVALLSAVDQLEDADANNIFLWSHSMGGDVSLRVLLATDTIRASSFWSTTNLDELTHRIGEVDGPVIVHHSDGDEATPIANSESLAKALSDAGLLATFHRYPESDHFFAAERRTHAADLDAELFLGAMQ